MPEADAEVPCHALRNLFYKFLHEDKKPPGAIVPGGFGLHFRTRSAVDLMFLKPALTQVGDLISYFCLPMHPYWRWA
jgi:hypothetical protein